jgi:hypothetical protein
MGQYFHHILQFSFYKSTIRFINLYGTMNFTNLMFNLLNLQENEENTD